MRKRIAIKIFVLVFAMVIMLPIIFNYEAEAGSGSSSEGKITYSNVWVLQTNKAKYSNGNKTLHIQTYIKNGSVYEQSSYIPDLTVKFDGNAGSSSVTVENTYSINRVELWRSNVKEITSNNGNINIDFGTQSNKTLKIYLDEKYNDLSHGGNENVAGGEVTISKTATPVQGSTNLYDLEFSAIGTAISKEKNADIILVFDKSGSMKESIGSKTKAQVLEEAANRFIDKVLPPGKTTNNRVAIVTYSDEAQVLQPFTSTNNTAKSKYKNYNNKVEGGTNSESGFIMSREVFASSFRPGAERFVIYMTDGVPTQYFNINGEVVGLGNSYDVTAKDAAIDEANLLKNFGGSGVKIYTVGLAPTNTSQMQALLNPTSKSYQEGYYHALTANDLTDIYDLLAAAIINAITTDTKVTDTLPDDFVFVKDSLPAGVTISEEDVLTWNLGSITNEKASKKVRVKYIGEDYGIVYSNKEAKISYKHVLTPTQVIETQFDNPLSIILPNISQYVYYTNKGEDIIITPPDISLVNEAGDEYAVSDLRIKTDGVTSKPHSTVGHNSDNTEIIFKPQSQGFPEDAFSYTVYFTVSSNTDPYNLMNGNSKVYEQKVNVVVNPHPSVNLTIKYFEVFDGTNRPLSINGNSSVVIPLPKDALIDEFAPSVTGYDLIDITHDGIVNPVVSGRRITGKAGTKNVTINYYYERDDSIVFDNVLFNHSMYANNELTPIHNGIYSLVPGINYRFGFEFQAGQNVSELGLNFTGNTGNFTISNFSLYDQNNILVGGPVNNINQLNLLINANNIYTITYNVLPNSSSSSLSATVKNVIAHGTAPMQININSIDILELE